MCARLLQVGYMHTQGEAGKLVCVFSQPVPQSAVPEATLDGASGGGQVWWWAPDKSVYSCVWVSHSLYWGKVVDFLKAK